METTSLYVELIIIGLETLTWITSFSILFTDIEHISIIKDIFEKLPASIFVLGIMYVLGLVFDRFADIVFKKTERKIRSIQRQTAATATDMNWQYTGSFRVASRN